MKVPMPRIYLGTMTFGWQQTSSYVDEAAASKMIKKYIEFGKDVSDDTSTKQHYIDTARVYSGGKSEKILGVILKDTSTYCDRDSVRVGTKAHPSQPGGLSKDGIMNQFTTSVESMGVDAVGEFYLHQPDTEHSLLESLQCVNELIVAGKVKTLGLSNYHVSEVVRAFELCEEYNLTKPGVYQVRTYYLLLMYIYIFTPFQSSAILNNFMQYISFRVFTTLSIAQSRMNCYLC